MTTLAIEIEPRADRIDLDSEHLTVFLSDGRRLAVPITWFPRLSYGTPGERSEYELWMDGAVIAWPLLDEHIPLTSLIAGQSSKEGTASFERWKVRIDTRRRAQDRGAWAKEHPLPGWWDEE